MQITKMTFETQRLDPQEMETEKKLSTILNNLGSKVIPNIELEPFHEDLSSEPEEGWARELWEEQMGVKLAKFKLF